MTTSQGIENFNIREHPYANAETFKTCTSFLMTHIVYAEYQQLYSMLYFMYRTPFYSFTSPPPPNLSQADPTSLFSMICNRHDIKL
jgi:hypothetical protein